MKAKDERGRLGGPGVSPDARECGLLVILGPPQGYGSVAREMNGPGRKVKA